MSRAIWVFNSPREAVVNAVAAPRGGWPGGGIKPSGRAPRSTHSSPNCCASFAVKIAGEVKEVNFNTKLGRGVLQRRTMADVQDSAISRNGVPPVSSFIHCWGGRLI